ncbi:hypothetical protein L198_01353 [Cryptococcus wingfieldii CBS 7118]|uniref:Mediator of RNA polymerase II transcription subunit 4 n=1 Tax=Cryptococcus wingfieldii CBS 7118 TaxID=1295528 RepID=A0A1E3JZ84_9TREE|nr:hypothetical protein L198_01353 [Cryptococcus wingfieldii CBS 7118]ODO06121.1 hypothetical protein L198_01353 [Cryptococcus wingfieldii CBS 7118]
MSSPQPPRQSLLQNLSTQSLLLTHLFTALSLPLTPQTPPQISQLHTALQYSALDLAGLVREVEEHQKLWNKLQEKKEEVKQLERRVRGLVRSLEEGRRTLEGMVDQGVKEVAAIDKSEKEPILAKTLLAHAQALGKHSSAPVSTLLAPVDRAQYTPWPTEMNMRMGLLFQLEGSMSGMGETGMVGDQQAAQPEVEERREEPVQVEESGRRYDPNAVFQLDLNSDDSDDD